MQKALRPLYLVVHTGSRHLGEEVAEYYTKLANACLKEQGREVPYYMSYLEGGYVFPNHPV